MSHFPQSDWPKPLDAVEIVEAVKTCDALRDRFDLAAGDVMTEAEGEAIGLLRHAALILLTQTPARSAAGIGAKLEHVIREAADFDIGRSPLPLAALHSALSDCQALDRVGAVHDAQGDAPGLSGDLAWHADIAWSAITWPTVDEVMTGLQRLADLRAHQDEHDDAALAVFRDLADFYLAKAPARSLTEAAQKLRHLEATGGGYDIFTAPLDAAIFHSVITDLLRLEPAAPAGGPAASEGADEASAERT